METCHFTFSSIRVGLSAVHASTLKDLIVAVRYDLVNRDKIWDLSRVFFTLGLLFVDQRFFSDGLRLDSVWLFSFISQFGWLLLLNQEIFSFIKQKLQYKSYRFSLISVIFHHINLTINSNFRFRHGFALLLMLVTTTKWW